MKYTELIEKFNRNHSPVDGRFTSAAPNMGGGSNATGGKPISSGDGASGKASRTKTKKETQPRATKVQAYLLPSRIPASLSNYIYDSHPEGFRWNDKVMRETIKSQPFDGKKITEALNNMKNSHPKFSLYKQTEKEILITATDRLDNQSRISIRND